MPLTDGDGLIRGTSVTFTTTLSQPSEVVETVRVGGGLSPLPVE